MITAQSRGVHFEEIGKIGWGPTNDEGDVLQDVTESLGFAISSPENGYRNQYLRTLDDEGEAFRQRFVDYTPPEETP